jgi:hypothetical protein
MAMVRVVVGLALAVGLGACGSAGDGGSDEATGSAPVVTAAEIDWSGTELPEGWTMQALEVDGLRAVDERTLAVEGRVVRVRLEDGSCVGEVGGRAEDEGHPDVVWIQASLAGPGIASDEALEQAEEQGPCPEEAVTVEIDLPRPLGGRDVRVSPFELWVPDGDAYAPCELPGCDPETGDPPATASCVDEAALVDDVRTHGDVGQHAAIAERRCEGGWAMVEADIGDQRVDRLFLRAGSPHWEVITRTREAGCADVATVEPAFPTHLCADRPAL